MRIGAAPESDPTDWDEMLSVNVQGLLYVTRASLPHLIRAAAETPRRVADVVNISSTAGRVSYARADCVARLDRNEDRVTTA
jgi:NADP-dependent 3-hydroxy acid dehydrogenase YdfG